MFCWWILIQNTSIYNRILDYRGAQAPRPLSPICTLLYIRRGNDYNWQEYVVSSHRKQEQICEAQNASAKPFTFVHYADISLYISGGHRMRKFFCMLNICEIVLRTNCEPRIFVLVSGVNLYMFSLSQSADLHTPSVCRPFLIQYLVAIGSTWNPPTVTNLRPWLCNPSVIIIPCCWRCSRRE